MSNIQDAAEAVQNAIDAFNARNFSTYFKLFTSDLESYAGVHTPLRFEGLAAWKEFIDGLAVGTAHFEQRHPTYRDYNGNTVVANGYFVFTSQMDNGPVQVQSGRHSYTVVKIEGKWLIANQHYSAMF
jgi:ketosteroid isomerase-like protein